LPFPLPVSEKYLRMLRGPRPGKSRGQTSQEELPVCPSVCLSVIALLIPRSVSLTHRSALLSVVLGVRTHPALQQRQPEQPMRETGTEDRHASAREGQPHETRAPTREAIESRDEGAE
ncbi:unnamed protein product, partial [Gadus morhua 'NCC']